MKPVKKGSRKPKNWREIAESSPMMAAAGAGALVLLIGLSILLSSGWTHGKDTGIILPGSEGDSPGVSTGSTLLTGQSVADVEITTGNAQTVIATLSRPASYRCKVSNTIYYQDGSATLNCRRYALAGVLRTDTVDADDKVRSTLLRKGSTVYAWNEGDSSAYQGAAGDFSDDAAAMLPTYEDVLAENVTLTAAGRENIGYEPCITVTFEQGGYRCVYAVSTVSGLLRQASFYDGDTLARRVDVSDVSTETQDSSLFALPDGTALLN